MEVVVTHDASDFDAVASAVAAQKLYPGACIVFGKHFGRDVREFMSLHKDRFRAVASDDLDASAVRRVIVVDVRRASRLAHIAALRDRILARDPGLEVHVWDHHAAAPDDIPAHFEKIERVGSATTLLIEEIQARHVAVDSVEATLFALGIHVDTGSLRYSATSARDAHALAWALANGARLTIINRYLEPPFTDGQRRALAAVLSAMRFERIGGAKIGVAEVAEGYAVDGLSEVTSEALALEDIHALFVSFALHGGSAHIIGRSRDPWLDVGRALQTIGGGGHATAAAATVRHGTGSIDSMLAALRADAPRPVRVREIMSSPVHSVSTDVNIRQLAESLASWGHTGAPVMKEDRAVGIVSRRDVEHAIARARESDRVTRHMSSPVETIEEDAPLDEALARMVASDIGRLLVTREARVVGIITRRDILEVLYGSSTADR